MCVVLFGTTSACSNSGYNNVTGKYHIASSTDQSFSLGFSRSSNTFATKPTDKELEHSPKSPSCLRAEQMSASVHAFECTQISYFYLADAFYNFSVHTLNPCSLSVATTIWTPPPPPPNTSQTHLYSLSLILPSCSSYFSLLPGARRSVPDGNSLRLHEPLSGHTEEGQAGNNQAQCSCLSGSL